CTTPQERLTWAREHHVEPPSYAILPAQGWDDRRHADKDEACPACELCARQQPAAPEKSCCSRAEKSPDDPAPRAKRTRSVRWVVGVFALRCHGVGTDWLASGVALPPPVPVVWRPAMTASGWVRYSPP